MKLTICGHASVLVETEAARVLVDPVFDDHYASGTMAFYPARRFLRESMPPLSALLVTHAHLDHYHPPTLRTFDRSLPVIVPDEPWLLGEVRALGFEQVVPLADWAQYAQGDLTITATPSEFDWDELGALFTQGDVRYWHMSDSVVKRAVGEQLVREHGRPTVVAARYQPVQVLPGHLRGLGSSFDERPAVVDWLEAAAVTAPRFLFPYAWAVAYVGRHAWANRHLGPWSAEEIARLYARRLPETQVEVLRPGDELELGPDRVGLSRARSPWVREVPIQPEPQGFEPIDATTLAGVPESLREPLRRLTGTVLTEEVLPFLDVVLDAQPNPFHNFGRWGVVHQLVVHAGEGVRLEWGLDFRAGRPLLVEGRHPDANFFTHLSGEALHRVLTGEGGTELFWMSGDIRQYEKILFIDGEGRFASPPLSGWDLFDALPDPLVHYLRRYRP